MEEAERTHVQLGSTAEQTPIFDLLTQHEDLTKQDIEKIKNISAELLQGIVERIRHVQGILQKQSTRDTLRNNIYDLLYQNWPSIGQIRL